MIKHGWSLAGGLMYIKSEQSWPFSLESEKMALHTYIQAYQNNFYFTTSYGKHLFFLRKNHGLVAARFGCFKLTPSPVEALKVNESRGLRAQLKGMSRLSPINAAMVKFQCKVKITPSNFFRVSLHVFPPPLCSLVLGVEHPSSLSWDHSQLHFQNIVFLEILKSGCRQLRTEEPTAVVTFDFISILSGNTPTIEWGQNDLLSAEERWEIN